MKSGSEWSNRIRRLLAPLLLVSVVSGCVTTGPANPADPLEGFNRTMFKFNDAVDTVALKPAATVYKNVLPSFVQTGVGNFFGNLADAWTAVNNLLQGKVEAGMSDIMRVAVNTTMGMGGLLDIGSEAGLSKHKEDFGQTLGHWGVKSGPYVVLPMFGPSTLRDTLAFPLDLKGDPWSYAEPAHTFVLGSVVRVVDLRAAALDASNLVEDAALDRYEFIRDAYLQRRESKVHDGESMRDKSAALPGADAAPPTATATQLVPLDTTLASRAVDGVKLAEVVVAEVPKAQDETGKLGLAQKGEENAKANDDAKVAGKTAVVAKEGKTASGSVDAANAQTASTGSANSTGSGSVNEALSSETVAK